MKISPIQTIKSDKKKKIADTAQNYTRKKCTKIKQNSKFSNLITEDHSQRVEKWS